MRLVFIYPYPYPYIYHFIYFSPLLAFLTFHVRSFFFCLKFILKNFLWFKSANHSPHFCFSKRSLFQVYYLFWFFILSLLQTHRKVVEIVQRISNALFLPRFLKCNINKFVLSSSLWMSMFFFTTIILPF